MSSGLPISACAVADRRRVVALQDQKTADGNFAACGFCYVVSSDFKSYNFELLEIARAGIGA